MQMQGSFNANQFEPNQGMTGHPPALKIPFTITNTAIVENSSKDGGMFVVDFTSQLGTQIHRYNIWNKSPKAVEIAHGQLSALCRAVGRFQIDWSNEGAALKGAQGLMDVGYQKGEEPDPAFPDRKGYTELKKVYDMAGNEPGKAPAQPANNGFTQQQPQQPQNNAAPLTQQAGGGWSQGQTTQATQTTQNNAQQPSNQAGGAWQPGAGGNAAPATNPPWGNRG